MKNFAYVRSNSVDEAVRAHGQSADTAYLAGGTNLIDYMKEGAARLSTVVDLRRLPLTQIEDRAGGLRLGALATNSAVAYHELVGARYPVLSQALLSGASPQLRNVATVAGNVLQRTRCVYFRDTAWPCNKREPGTGCPAFDGFNRSHAILGGGPACIATHASDMCVALAALEAVVQTQGPNGVRSIPFREFYRLPGETPQFETALEPGELITAVDVPALPFARRSCYLKVRDRASYEFALASAAVALDFRAGVVFGARIALGGIGTIPWRAVAAEEALAGQKADEENFRAAAEVALRDVQPRQHNAFKVELAKRTLVVALSTAAKLEVA